MLLVAFFSKNYLFSIMLAIFYTVLNFLTSFGMFTKAANLVFAHALHTNMVILRNGFPYAASGKSTGYFCRERSYSVYRPNAYAAVLDWYSVCCLGDLFIQKKGGITMVRIIKTEFWKLKRYYMIWAGVALMFLCVLLTLYTSIAQIRITWDFQIFVEQVMQINVIYNYPMCITLMFGYIVNREIKDDTLKNLVTIPIPMSKIKERVAVV